MMLTYPDFKFSPVNLYTVAMLRKRTRMDEEDLDLEFLYTSLAKVGKKPSPDDEDRFIALIDNLVGSPTASRFSARRDALRKLYG